MSGLVTGLVMRTPVTPKFSKDVKFTAMVYAEHAWPDGTHAYPAVETVADFIGCSTRSVQRYVRTLEEIGMLIPDGKGPRGTNNYKFPLQNMPDGSARLNLQPPVKGGDNLSPRQIDGVTAESGDRDSGDTGVTRLKEPLLKTPTTANGENSELQQQYPNTMPEADQNPFIRLFRDVSGVFPGTPYWIGIVDALWLIAKNNKLESWDDLKAFITPYWLAWSTRKGKDGKGYNKLNPTWLTEWAVGGQIPLERGQHAAEKLPTQKRSSTRQGGQTDTPKRSEDELARAQAAAERINAKRLRKQATV